MKAGARTLVLTAHVVSSVGWIGALAAFSALAIAGLISNNAETVRAAYIAGELITSIVIVPLAAASLLTGFVQALSPDGGFFRRYWVLFKLVLAVVATSMLLMKTGSISYLANTAAETALSATDMRGLRVSLAVHGVGGLVVLLWAATLGVYKPRGTIS